MTNVAMSVEQICKEYHIGKKQRGYKTLREQISDSFAAPWRRLTSVMRGGTTSISHNTFWALDDVSFEVKKGEVVGIIGSNGAGKSTLLKILSRITEPTKGRAQINGRVASLLEVGTGFHPELTGRENIYLNGAILGMKRTEIDRKLDEIIAFAEVENFIDTPVKHYSSGMYLRLAFAVAAHLEPEILLVDEVLAVGDAAFQKKCLGRMGEVAKQGRTVFLVSHNMASIARLSDWCLWLDSGKLVGYGEPEDIITSYLASGIKESGELVFPEDQLQSDTRRPGHQSEYIRLLAVRIKNNDGVVTPTLDIRQPFIIEIEYKILKRATNLRIGLTLTSQDSTAILSSKDTDNTDHLDELEHDSVREPGVYVNRCTIPGDFLNTGQYFISIGSDFPMLRSHFYLERVLAFHIEQTGGAGGHISDRRRGLLRMRFPWDTQKIE